MAPSRDELPRPRKGEHYLGGPIPLGWLSRAADLPGKALHVSLALWFEALVRRSKGPVVQPRRATLGRFGAGSRRTLYRSLRALEGAGLVRVERRVGRPFRVTILPADPGAPTPATSPADPTAE
jgi:hypothetical protein